MGAVDFNGDAFNHARIGTVGPEIFELLLEVLKVACIFVLTSSSIMINLLLPTTRLSALGLRKEGRLF